MNKCEQEYYHQMLLRERLIPLYRGNKLGGLLTFFIGDGNIDKYVRNDPWTIIDDEPDTGHVCYVDQLITDKNINNRKYSWAVITNFIRYIQEKYPLVDTVRWNHLKGGQVHVFHKSLRRSRIRSITL